MLLEMHNHNKILQERKAKQLTISPLADVQWSVKLTDTLVFFLQVSFTGRIQTWLIRHS
jgi:hypothetical protein